MARATILALSFAMAVSGARYADYSGVKMPEYGGGTDYEGPRDLSSHNEYRDIDHDRPPGSAASLDYKYDDDTVGKANVVINDVEDTEIIQKSTNKPRRPIDRVSLDTIEKYSPNEMVPKLKSSHRLSKHRPRLKIKSRRSNYVISKRQRKFSRHRNDDYGTNQDNDNFQLNHDNFNEDELHFTDGTSDYGRRETTMRVIRRKPRDRFIKSSSDNESNDEDDHIPLRAAYESESKIKQGYADEEMLRGNMKRRPTQAFDSGETEVGAIGAYEGIKRAPPESGELEGYNDYYDIKRLKSIKSRIPNLLRRTNTVRTTVITAATRTPASVWTNYRRAPFPDPKLATWTAKSMTTTISTIATKTTSATTVQITTNSSLSKEDEQILSIAEQSRLSILKKAQRKEISKNGTSTKKPPVLLQVTNIMQTMIMVEPPSSMDPWMRAKEVSDDTPERLEKVKQMMRHKLVANAKNIHDLTDNWDELICDYVDVAVLDSAASNLGYNVFLTVLVMVLNCLPRSCLVETIRLK